MIVADKKPIEEIIEQIQDKERILILGCNECVTVCEAGGKKEVGVLASALRMYFANQGVEKKIGERTLERQCDHEYLDELRDVVGDYDAVVSLACGVGVQFTATMMPSFPLPAASAFSSPPNSIPPCRCIPGSIPASWAPRSAGGYGPSGVRGAASACWPIPAAYVRFPDAPNAFSTDPAVVLPGAAAKSIRRLIAPGSLSSIGSRRLGEWKTTKS
jgi:hypothetical protein